MLAEEVAEQIRQEQLPAQADLAVVVPVAEQTQTVSPAALIQVVAAVVVTVVEPTTVAQADLA